MVLVDCGAENLNHLFSGNCQTPVAVIDHHETRPERRRVPFRDVRPRVAAAVSIAADYLREQRMVPDAALATAILYAIRTETRGYRDVLFPAWTVPSCGGRWSEPIPPGWRKSRTRRFRSSISATSCSPCKARFSTATRPCACCREPKARRFPEKWPTC